MKFLFIISLLGVGFQSVSAEKLEIDSSVEDMLSLYASEVKNCDVDELSISSFNDVKNICQGLVNSEVCADIKPEYLVDCNNLVSDGSEIELQRSDDSSLWNECIPKEYGGGSFKTAMLPLVAVASLLIDDLWSAESLDNSRSTWNYYRAEDDRLNEEDSVFSTLGTMALSSGRNRELEHGCLNKKGQRRVKCSLVHETIQSTVISLMSGFSATGGGAIGGAIGGAVLPSVGGYKLGSGIVTSIDSDSRIGAAVVGTAGAVVGTGVGILASPVTVPVGAGIGAGIGLSAWLNSFVAVIKTLPQEAMKSVKKDSSSLNASSNLETNSSSAGE